MAYNYVIFASDESSVADALGETAELFEIFPMPSGNMGMSVPTKYLDRLDLKRLRHFEVLDFANGTRLHQGSPS